MLHFLFTRYLVKKYYLMYNFESTVLLLQLDDERNEESISFQRMRVVFLDFSYRKKCSGRKR